MLTPREREGGTPQKTLRVGGVSAENVGELKRDRWSESPCLFARGCW